MLLEEPELREIQGIAGAQRMTVAARVRQARLLEPRGRAEKKSEILRTAVRHGFPSGDMPTMLAEIEGGYGSGEHG